MSAAISLSIFWIGSILGVLGGVFACRINKRFIDFFFCLLLVSMLFPDWSIHFLSREFYRSQIRGIEVHVADLCLLILIIVMPATYRKLSSLPLIIPGALFLFFSVIAWMLADTSLTNPFPREAAPEDIPYTIFETKLYPLFEMFQLFKSFFIYWICINFFHEKKYLNYFLILALMMAYGFGIQSLINRYYFGMHRVTVLYYVTDFNCFMAMLGGIIFPFIYFSKNTLKKILFFIGMIFILIALVLSISRSGIFSLGVTLFFATFLCLLRSFNLRNIVFTLLIAAGGMAVVGKGYETLYSRFFISEATDEALRGRERYEEIAWTIAKDYPLGVGMGNYTAYLSHYYPEFAKNTDNVMVHNVWYLTLVEVGIMGLLSLVFYWLRVAQIAARTLWNSFLRSDLFTFGLVLGCVCALLNFQFRSFFHFTYRILPLLYYTQVILAVIVSQYLVFKDQRRKVSCN